MLGPGQLLEQRQARVQARQQEEDELELFMALEKAVKKSEDRDAARAQGLAAASRTSR